MARRILVAEFHDYGTAHRTFVELLHNGIDAGSISLIAGDLSDHHGAQRDFGILEADADHWHGCVRRGITLLAVRAHDHQRARLRQIIGQRAPLAIEEVGAEVPAG
jgi:hypothetical protein